MTKTENIIHQANADDVAPEGCACLDCGLPFKSNYESCPACGGSNIRPIEEVINSESTD